MLGLSVLILGGLSLAFAVFLVFAARRFKIVEDPLVAKIEEILPGSNCGACGFAGCHALAELMASRKADAGACITGGTEVANRIAALLGVTANVGELRVASIHCQGGKSKVKNRFEYVGIKTCLSAHTTAGGPNACFYGCLGWGDCVRNCSFGALSLGVEGLPVVDENKCVACGKCVAVCPRKIITLIPRRKWVYVGCVSRDRGKVVKDICPVGCIGCGICAKVTKSGAITMDDNLPRLHVDKGLDFEEAVQRCPAHCFVVRFTPRT